MKKELFIGLTLLVVGAGIFLFTNQQKEKLTTETKQTTVSTQTDTTTTKNPKEGIPITEIAKHTNASSCWMVINGNVYDVTKYISSHPGGETILLGCGKDATDLFTGIATMGKRHSNKAQSLLAQLLVGPLVK